MTPLQPQPKGKNSKEFRTLYHHMLREALRNGELRGLDFGDGGLMLSDEPGTTAYLNTLEKDFAALTEAGRAIHPRFLPHFKEDGELFKRVLELRAPAPPARPVRVSKDSGAGGERPPGENAAD